MPKILPKPINRVIKGERVQLLSKVKKPKISPNRIIKGDKFQFTPKLRKSIKRQLARKRENQIFIQGQEPKEGKKKKGKKKKLNGDMVYVNQKMN